MPMYCGLLLLFQVSALAAIAAIAVLAVRASQSSNPSSHRFPAGNKGITRSFALWPFTCTVISEKRLRIHVSVRHNWFSTSSSKQKVTGPRDGVCSHCAVKGMQ
jgi:hypothetical protein